MMRTLTTTALLLVALAAMAPPVQASHEPWHEPQYGCPVDNEKVIVVKVCVLFVPGQCLAVGFRIGEAAQGVGQCT